MKWMLSSCSSDRWLNYSLVLAVLFYAINFIFLGFLLSPYDFDHLAGYYEIAWRWWQSGSGLPHFNPYLCGGRPLAGDPQIPIFHPLIWLVPVIGPVWLIKIEMVLQLLVGSIGLSGVIHRLGCSRESRLWGVLVYICGGAIVSRFLVGHVALGFFLLFPAFLMLSYKLVEHPRNTFWIASYWLLFYYGSLHKPNFAIYALPILIVEVGIRSICLHSWIPLLHLFLAALVGTVANLASYLPAWEYFHHYPRLADGIANSTPYLTFFWNLLAPLKTLPEGYYGPHYFARHEYCVFVGIVPVLLAAIGLCEVVRKRLSIAKSLWIPIFISAVFAVSVGMGADTAKFGIRPYTWLHTFWPGFDSVRAPMRCWYMGFLAVILLSCVGLERTRSDRRRAWILLGIVPLITHAGINLSKTSVLSQQTQWAVPRNNPSNFEWRAGGDRNHYLPIRQGYGIRHCFFNLGGPPQTLTDGPLIPAELSFVASWSGWNRIEIQGHPQGSRSLTFNISHSPFWRLVGSKGTITSSDSEALSITLDRQQDTALVYELPSLKKAMSISVLGMALAVVLLIAFGYYSKGMNLKRIGLTGSIGSGKSEVAKLLLEKKIPVIDLDSIGREITTRPNIIQKIHREFGPQVILKNGQLDRAAMREHIFSCDVSRKKLEAILHPLIWAEFERHCENLAKQGIKLVVCEASLIFEAGLDKKLDGVIAVSASDKVRRVRLAVRDGMSPEQFDLANSAQFREVDKLKKATAIIDNSGGIEDLRPQVDNLIKKWKNDHLV